jgi:hypothetical protein
MHRRISSNEFVRLPSHDSSLRDAFTISQDVVSKSLDVFDDFACSADDGKSWRDIQVSKRLRVSNDLTFEQWHGEQLAALEENVIASMSMSHDEYEFALQSLQSSIPVPTDAKIEEDDDSSSSDGEGNSKRTNKKRPNVREHSKAQREKRKATINGLEDKAKRYSTELAENSRVFRETLEKYVFRRKYCHETLNNFLTMWIRGEESEEAWQVVVDVHVIEMSLPFTTTRFRPPGQVVNSRRVLKGVTEIIADAASLSVMCITISNLGLVPFCKFQLHIEIPVANFFLEEDVAMADMNIYSKNAAVCGGKYEIHVDGTPHPTQLHSSHYYK